ncbi:substrate-binding periplasmic protein [Pseudoalteromonas aurantia]|uniref:Solute-binding protein family 3/N-terminal domain-containing protein n=1 Tax=Pseudoalteromonas aurantia 208 TaxID=1314867 RepID=A0ABR9EBV4_9GAMM|nr:transporter substrate-binding domain-containing protein [Pseudoalteromonas aurantia]MBE0367248.1 hypothetical protein [Pseudoalteromonas aurantia 208]
MRFVLVVMALFLSIGLAHAKTTVRITVGADPYIQALLKLALSYDEEDVQLEFVNDIPTQKRAIRLLGKDNGIDVFWSVTSSKREKLARAIRIPLVKGVLGYRLGLIRKSDVARMKKLNTIGDFYGLHFGLRDDWPDLDIFRKNNLKVVSYPREGNAYEMLRSGRFDVLPMDVLNGVYLDTESGIQIDPYHIYYYPSAVYFFVAKTDTELHQKLKMGLEAAQADGQFDTLFNRYFAEQLQDVNFSSRKQIDLINPLLPPSAPLSNPIYWYKNNKGS